MEKYAVKKAKIFHDQINAIAKYPDGKSYLLNDVFSIVSTDLKPAKRNLPTTAGDSGAISDG